MDQQVLNRICEQIYQRFPQVSGRQPKVQSRPDQQHLLIFSGTVQAADGRKIAQTVRVVVSQDGRIVKTTASR
jgi:hypothetical protein